MLKRIYIDNYKSLTNFDFRGQARVPVDRGRAVIAEAGLQ
jgi:hypothetical protein